MAPHSFSILMLLVCAYTAVRAAVSTSMCDRGAKESLQHPPESDTDCLQLLQGKRGPANVARSSQFRAEQHHRLSSPDLEVLGELHKNNSSEEVATRSSIVSNTSIDDGGSPDMHAIVYQNPDYLHQTNHSLTINGTQSIVPGTYTKVSGDNVTIKDLDNDAMQGDGVHVYVGHGKENSNNHVNLHVKDGGRRVCLHRGRATQREQHS